MYKCSPIHTSMLAFLLIAATPWLSPLYQGHEAIALAALTAILIVSIMLIIRDIRNGNTILTKKRSPTSIFDQRAKALSLIILGCILVLFIEPTENKHGDTWGAVTAFAILYFIIMYGIMWALHFVGPTPTPKYPPLKPYTQGLTAPYNNSYRSGNYQNPNPQRTTLTNQPPPSAPPPQGYRT